MSVFYQSLYIDFKCYLTKWRFRSMDTESDFGLKDITAQMIKAVRKETRAGTIDCRDALIESRGDVDRAIEILKEKGIETPKKVYI